MFSTWLSRWALIPDGIPIVTHTSQLLPVTTIRGGKKAILKLTRDDSERNGCQLMVWWNIFTNPDLANPGMGVAIEPQRFIQRVHIVSEVAGLERERLLLWALVSMVSARGGKYGDNPASGGTRAC